jgi:hypothetical protein
VGCSSAELTREDAWGSLLIDEENSEVHEEKIQPLLIHSTCRLMLRALWLYYMSMQI